MTRKQEFSMIWMKNSIIWLAMLAMEDPSIASVIDAREYAPKREMAFSFYILWM
jgi:hypothetical protein